MAVKITGVSSDSVCARRGILPGYSLLSVNGHEINDVLDYRFYAGTKRLTAEFSDKDNNSVILHLKTQGNADDLGLCFDTYLMDKQHSCKNKCIFCFVDQMPEGMRKSLYFKDDDSRLSFLFGNYVTLTNMSQAEVERLISMHISPVNISVHTMNPSLRVEMMKNPHAGEVLSYIKMLADAGIEINAQLVLCPGINDGEELLYSLEELYKLGDSIVSVAAVPVGLTKFRDGLYDIKPYDDVSAGAVIDMIDEFNKSRFTDISRNFAFAADEFYLKAGREVPDAEYYDEFRQLDNGVGLITLARQEFYEALGEVNDCPAKKIAVVTGAAAYPLMCEFARAVNDKFNNVNVDVREIKNDFFGHSVTVAGLVTATDIINQCGDMSDYDYALIPSVMLRGEDDKVFLDDISLEELENRLNVKIISSPCSGRDLLYNIIEKESE